MFAAEIEMEKKSSNLGPLIMVLALVAVVGGTIFYFFKTAREVLTVPVATTSVNEILKAQGGGQINFSVGTVVSSVNEKPMDPHYKLLAKAGILTVKPKSWNSIIATLTPAGEKVLSEIPGVEKGKNSDGNVTYSVPLAERKIVQIDKITMIKPHLARVDYTWKWVPNRLGKEFDASGDLVHTLQHLGPWNADQELRRRFLQRRAQQGQRRAGGKQRRRLEAVRRVDARPTADTFKVARQGGVPAPPCFFLTSYAARPVVACLHYSLRCCNLE